MKYLSQLHTKFFAFLLFVTFNLIGINCLKASNWNESLNSAKGFIENKGQFNVKTLKGKKIEVLYAFDGGSEDYYFTKNGVVMSYTLKEKRKKSDQEKLQRIERKKKGFTTQKEWQDFDLKEEKEEN